MLSLSLECDLTFTDPQATLDVPFETIEGACLSIAGRATRNRTALYQRKHRSATLATRDRDASLADLNRTIAEHYRLLCKQKKADDSRPVIAFAISDLTANPLRPHYDVEIGEDDRALTLPASVEAVYRRGPSARLFHLEDEPLGEAPYTLLA